MKHTFRTLSLIAVLVSVLTLGACTRNDGNIGKQFGQWKVTHITFDGKEDATYYGNIYWSFQNSTIEMKRVEANHEAYSTFGNYRIMDETLFITFPDDSRPPMPGFGFKPLVENEIQIVRLTSTEMTLAYETASDDSDTPTNVMIYLRKW